MSVCVSVCLSRMDGQTAGSISVISRTHNTRGPGMVLDLEWWVWPRGFGSWSQKCFSIVPRHVGTVLSNTNTFVVVRPSWTGKQRGTIGGWRPATRHGASYPPLPSPPLPFPPLPPSLPSTASQAGGLASCPLPPPFPCTPSLPSPLTLPLLPPPPLS